MITNWHYSRKTVVEAVEVAGEVDHHGVVDGLARQARAAAAAPPASGSSPPAAARAAVDLPAHLHPVPTRAGRQRPSPLSFAASFFTSSLPCQMPSRFSALTLSSPSARSPSRKLSMARSTAGPGAASVELLAREDQVEGGGESDQARRALRPASARQNP